MVVINKIDSADAAGIDAVRRNIAAVNPDAVVIDAASALEMDNPAVVRGKRVLAVEDGPTLTHGGMKIGAAVVAARKFGAAELVDPRPYLMGRLKETFRIYPGIGAVLPAVGYGAQQLKDLEATINRTTCDAVVIGTPIDLKRIITITKPSTRVYYNLQEIGKPDQTTCSMSSSACTHRVEREDHSPQPSWVRGREVLHIAHDGKPCQKPAS